MSQPATTQVQVYVDLAGTPVRAGTAYISERRGVASTSFAYDPAYQGDRRGYPLSPDLALVFTRHHLNNLPGVFGDSAPDRWGRNLIRKRVQAQARLEKQAAPSLAEVDFLLGVSDLTRQGALRYALNDQGPFLAAHPEVPKLLELPRLLSAADLVADDGEDDYSAVMALLDAGSGSLGGARPKASVRDGDRLLIAKFPHRSDEWDVMAWEKTALDLAARAGIRTPGRELVQVGGRNVLLLDRFDRDRAARIGYISAVTMVGGRDGGSSDYLEIAEALSEHGSAVTEDLAELWRRMAFSVVINNTDDHLRNHGFLHTGAGWSLCPVFDVNPEPDLTRARATSIGYNLDPDQGPDALFNVAPDFGLNEPTRLAIFDEVLDATSAWRDVAAANGISEREHSLLAGALDRFRHAQN